MHLVTPPSPSLQNPPIYSERVFFCFCIRLALPHLATDSLLLHTVISCVRASSANDHFEDNLKWKLGIQLDVKTQLFGTRSAK